MLNQHPQRDEILVISKAAWTGDLNVQGPACDMSVGNLNSGPAYVASSLLPETSPQLLLRILKQFSHGKRTLLFLNLKKNCTWTRFESFMTASFTD